MELNIIFTLLNAVIFYPMANKKNIVDLYNKTENIIHSEYLIFWIALINKISNDSILISENRDDHLKKFIQFTIDTNKDIYESEKFYKFFKIVLKYSFISTIICAILLIVFIFLNKKYTEIVLYNYNLSITISILTLSIFNFLLVAFLIFKDLSIGKIYHKYEDKFKI